MKPLSKDERLKELREEIREYGESGWHGADGATLKILAEVVDDRGELLNALEALLNSAHLSADGQRSPEAVCARATIKHVREDR